MGMLWNVVGEFCDVFERQVEVGRDQRRRRVGEPVRKRDALIRVGFEDLHEHQIGIADVLDVMTEDRRDVTDVAGLKLFVTAFGPVLNTVICADPLT
jgi:hypothetical protein